MLEVNMVTAHYGDIMALNEVILNVEKGEVVTIIGANGAGKSTLLRCISGLRRISSGSMSFEREDITGWRADRIVDKGLVHCPEGRAILNTMTVRENLEMGAFRLRGMSDPREDFENVFSLFNQLKGRQKQLAVSLSGGEQQMLAIGRTLMARPRLLMIDEPSLGLAPLLVSELFRVIGQLKERGMTILLVEQNAMQALRCSDRAYVFENGCVGLTGLARELLQDTRVRDVYLRAGVGRRMRYSR